MLAEQTTAPPLDRLDAVADRDDLVGAIAAARAVYVEESVGEYVVSILRHTRDSTLLALGASPRAGIALLRMAKARAVALGRDYVVPEDVQAVASRRARAPRDRRARGARRGHARRGRRRARARRGADPDMNAAARRARARSRRSVAAVAFGSRALGVVGVGFLLAAGVTLALGLARGRVRSPSRRRSTPAPATEGDRVRVAHRGAPLLAHAARLDDGPL